MLGEEKMLGSNRKGATSPASKKSSPETGKVRDGAAHPRDMGRGLLATWGALRLHFLALLRLEAPSAQLVPPQGLTPTHGCVSLLQASSEKPKRPISAMFIFSEEKRKQLQEERPDLSESELTRLLARMWNDLSEKKKVGTTPDPSPPSPVAHLWQCEGHCLSLSSTAVGR